MSVQTGDLLLDNTINEWIQWNKNPFWQKEAEKLLKDPNIPKLKKIFMERLEFGTAGLRGRMGPGYNQMNDLVIIQTAQGLMNYLKGSVGPLVKKNGVVIGYDGRHHSRKFAELSAAVFLHAGVPVYLFSRVCPTPFVPFAISRYECAAGIMVTASHNPKDDNGYKVYWGNGAQIIPPHDKGIAQSIKENLPPLASSWDVSILSEAKHSGMLHDPLSLDIGKEYYLKIEERVVSKDANANCPVQFAYTAMHGVAYPYIQEAFRNAGFKELIPVKEQIYPDPEFPTVKFPNPEEGKSALDLAVRTANQNGCKIILANDPDADRLAVAELSPSGDWIVLTGNEIGGLFGWWEMKVFREKHPDVNPSNVYLLSSTVSSKIVRTMANKQGFSFEETLTGFKWMGNRALELEANNKTVILAFEEAIGFMIGTAVVDKDGISAAVRLAEMASYLYSRDMTLTKQLANIYSEYGHHLSRNSYFICDNPVAIKKCFDRLRNYEGKPQTYPKLLQGTYKVTGVRDLTSPGYDSTTPDHKPTLPTSSSSQMITFSFDNGLIATLRTSGTEPKVKYYTELCAAPDSKDVTKLKEFHKGLVQSLIDEYLQPNVYGFQTRSG